MTHVIFGTGPVGMATMEALCADGHTVRMVNRSGRTSEPLPAGVDLVTGDASDPAFTTQATEGASVIYNALNPPYHKWVELFPGLQAAAIEAAANHGAKLVVMENLYMYGSPNAQPMTETTPYNPHTKKGRLRAQMSRDLMDAHEKGGVQVAVGRAADFFGPRVLLSAMGDRIMYPLVQGNTAQVLGNPDMPHTYTYMPDIGRALAILGTRDEATGDIWHLPNPETLTTRAFIERAAGIAGVEPKIQAAPELGVRMFGLFNPQVREVVEMLYQVKEPFIVDNSKYTTAFGEGATPLDDALRATVDWFRANPR